MFLKFIKLTKTKYGSVKNHQGIDVTTMILLLMTVHIRKFEAI